MKYDGLFSSNSDEWKTPKYLFDKLNKEYNFTLDPASTNENHLCDKWYTIKENGLIQSWKNERVFLNPPYGRQIKDWVKKAYFENQKNNTLVVMLIPARTDTTYFHDYIYHKAEIIFLKGRLKFNDGKGSAPFPSMIVIYKEQINNE